MNVEDLAETGRLQALLAQMGAGLDEYLRFEGSDAQTRRSQWLSALDEPLPQQGEGIESVLQQMLQQVIPNGSAVPNPGFCAYITTGATTASTLAATAAHIAAPQRYLLTAFNFIEELSLKWLAQMCRIEHLQGVYSSGGSVANLIALGGARQQAFEKMGIDPALDGVDRQVRVYASSECHHTIQRACGVLGLGRRAVQAIACDEKGRLRVDALRAAIESDLAQKRMPMAIVANAGTTNTGAIDPLQAIAEVAKAYGVWLHVDGAYGLPGILDERVAECYQGLEQADSVIVDPHKWLGAPVGIAATFVRDRALLQRAFTQGEADYLEGSVERPLQAGIEHSMDDFGIPYFDYSIELSAPSRGIMLWAMLKEIGVEGMRARIRRHNDMARHVASLAQAHDELELLLQPTLSICCFRYNTPGVEDLDLLNQQIFRRLKQENRYLPSTTRVNGKLAIRPCFIGARTEMKHADGLVQAVLRIGAELTGAGLVG